MEPSNTEASTSRFDRYEILGALGAGGMGEVVKARALGPHGFEKVVAIKRIRTEWAAQSVMAERFVREARIAARLHHANIVQVFDFGKHEDELFIVMEFVDGQSLDDILLRLDQEGKRPSLAQTLQITLDVVRALDSAHALTDDDGEPVGIIHRDVSPANILVSREGVVKLTDFGIAAWSSGAGEGRTSMVAGKPLYMAPEQLRGNPLDARADLFAAGLVLYQMLTGRRPWEGLVDASEDASLESMGYQPPSVWTTQLPPELDVLTARLLAPSLDERFANAREVMKEIIQISYKTQTVLDSSELADLVGDPVDQAHAPTVPQYESRPETLIASGVSPDGVTMLRPAAGRTDGATDDAPTDDARMAAAPMAPASARPGPPYLALAAVLLLLAVPFTVWAFGGLDAGASPAPIAVAMERTGARGPRGPARRARPGDEQGASSQVSAGDDAVEGEGRDEAPAAQGPDGDDTASAAADPEHEADPRDQRAEPSPDARQAADEGVEARAPRAPAPPRRSRPRAASAGAPNEGARPAPALDGTAGELDVFSRPWAEIYIDGRRQPQNAPARGIRVAPGAHRVRLVNPVLGLSEERTVTVPPNGRAQLRVFLEPAAASPTPPADPPAE